MSIKSVTMSIVAVAFMCNLTELYSQQWIFTPSESITEFSFNINYEYAFSDFDNDGDIDIVTINMLNNSPTSSNFIKWYENDGTGNFIDEHLVIDSIYPYNVYAYDIDNDSDVDIVYPSYRTISSAPFYTEILIGWSENDGSGNFINHHTITDSSSINKQLFFGDFNSDGYIDLVARGQNNLSWYENLGNGSFSAPHLISDTITVNTIFSADVTEDGHVDLIIGANYDQLFYLPNDGSGNFGNPISLTTNVYSVESISFSDIDGDGLKDIMYSSFYNDLIAWHKNYGAGNFSNQLIISDTAYQARNVITYDIDEDGDLDLIYTEMQGNLDISWLENDGFGNFGGVKLLYNPLITASNLRIDLVDLDGDIDKDLILMDKGSFKDLIWLENIGKTTFSDENVVSEDLNRNIRAVDEADFDQDGDMDYSIVDNEFNRILWYENDGNGVFIKNTVDSINNSFYSTRFLLAKDMDNDGYVDIVSGKQSADIVWYKNDGNGNFGNVSKH